MFILTTSFSPLDLSTTCVGMSARQEHDSVRSPILVSSKGSGQTSRGGPPSHTHDRRVEGNPSVVDKLDEGEEEDEEEGEEGEDTSEPGLDLHIVHRLPKGVQALEHTVSAHDALIAPADEREREGGRGRRAREHACC